MIYSFLRIISENGLDLGLRKDMAIFSSTILQERYKECSAIGRDLIRLLQDVSKLPEFSSIWKIITNNGTSGAVGGVGTEYKVDATLLGQLLKVPTPKRFLLSRLTPEMETNLLFILEHVKYGGINHRRYYDWFNEEYLRVNDPDSLIVDIVRYLIVSYHPTNLVLASNSVQRWQMISWLLRHMRSNYSTANTKLAIFFDWLFYDPLVDNIMNIEPAILIITKSITSSPKISSTMIEFLYFLKESYFPPLKPFIEKGIDRAIGDILSKRVISNLEVILLSEHISEDTRKQMKELFPCYFIKATNDMDMMEVVDNNMLNGNNIHQSNRNKINLDIVDNLVKIISEIKQSSDFLSFPKEKCFELMINFVQQLGSLTDSSPEDNLLIENLYLPSLTSLVNDNFSRFLRVYVTESDQNWADGLIFALTGPEIDKDVIDMAIYRISSLPEEAGKRFDIEEFLYSLPRIEKSPPHSQFEKPSPQLQAHTQSQSKSQSQSLSGSNLQSQQSQNASTLSLSSTSTVSKLSSSSSSSSSSGSSGSINSHSQLEYEKLMELKRKDPKLFYESCFVHFFKEFSESDNVIDLLGIVLEDTDSTDLFRLRTQIAVMGKCPFIVNFSNLVKGLRFTKNWDGYSQIFLWNLLEISMKLFIPTEELKVSFFAILNGGLLTQKTEDQAQQTQQQDEHSEISNAIVNMAISFYPQNPKDYFNWVISLLQVDTSEYAFVLPIISYYWRSNSKLFLQSLVKLDDFELKTRNEFDGVDFLKIQKSIILFKQFIVSSIEEFSPAKKSLITCLDTTVALLKQKQKN